jgi:carboxymethylenebutenolidase
VGAAHIATTKESSLPVVEEALTAGNVNLTGHEGATVNAYLAKPAGDGPFPGVLVIHHLPGWDPSTKEITRTFAAHGYNAICPNLYAREGLETDPDDAAAAARSKGGVPDEQFLGDAGAAIEALRALPTSNGKVGVIGYCSGGRQSFLTAVSLPVDAAVDCYGAFVTGQVPDGFPLKVVPIVDKTPDLRCPLLGLFGADDQFPNPEHVAELEEALKAAGKTYEFQSYEGAGHAFFSTNRTAFRPEAALDGWERIFAWYGRYLTTEA